MDRPEHLDDFIYRWARPTLLGTPLRDLTIRVDSSLVMVAAGGLMGLKTGVSLLLGAVVNYVVIAPFLIDAGIIRTAGFKAITMWALWGGVAMMTTSSLYAFVSKPQTIARSFRGTFGRSQRQPDILAHIELPMWVFALGIPGVAA